MFVELVGVGVGEVVVWVVDEIIIGWEYGWWCGCGVGVVLGGCGGGVVGVDDGIVCGGVVGVGVGVGCGWEKW